MTIPRALARLQFHAGFTFGDALPVVDYLADLGISHLYASPIWQARRGSTHGYDIVDYRRVNEELGGEPALRRLVARLREKNMGLIVDIVPNHMGIGTENAWWMDVLARGRESRYAGYFDIDWQSADPLVRGRVLLPVLGVPYAQALDAGDIALIAEGESFALKVYEQRLPLSPATLARLSDAGEPLASHDRRTAAGRARLDALVERQHYRLAYWKLASDMVNYRRFFDINELAGMRIERTAVFEDVHALVFRLYGEGLIDGLRCDHVDGLADPRRYCRQLRHRLDRLLPRRPPDAPGGSAYIVVEKILGEGEPLRREWRVDGTTGYEFMDQVSGVLHDPRGEAPLTALWKTVTDDRRDFASQARAARRQILVDSFEAELERTARALFVAARADETTRDVSLPALRRVIVELLVHFPVYRTYAGGTGRDAFDETVFSRAVDGARRTVRPDDLDWLDAVSGWLGGEAPRQLPPGPVRRSRERAMAVFQQATSPVAAKAVEDTACYRYGRLLSRNEVGADPGRFAWSPDAFHRATAERARAFPHLLLATATHDHKRGEDVRMRLAVLSEMAGEWAGVVALWRERHAGLRETVDGGMAPTPADELMLYQMLVGAWPTQLGADDIEGLKTFARRIAGWQRKALREAKRWTRWTSPNEPYEQACEAFLLKLLTESEPGIAADIAGFARRIEAAGAANALSQSVLRLTMPGVPDLYQGTEYWDLSLVDPDNRRPVDFAARHASLRAVRDRPLPELIGDWRSGLLKQGTIYRLLALRSRLPRLFARGSYVPLVVEGDLADHVFAFERRRGNEAVVVLVTRLTAGWLLGRETPSMDEVPWGDTRVVPGAGRYLDTLGGAVVKVSAAGLNVSACLGALGVAVLERQPARTATVRPAWNKSEAP
jgi:(1->4)-alpha-D-glucan 1-alpha-D-glucosylmutase